MRLVIFLAFLLPTACVASALHTAVNSAVVPDAVFREAVRAHAAAIQAHDLDGLMATVTTRDSLTLIFPEGEILSTVGGTSPVTDFVECS